MSLFKNTLDGLRAMYSFGVGWHVSANAGCLCRAQCRVCRGRLAALTWHAEAQMIEFLTTVVWNLARRGVSHLLHRAVRGRMYTFVCIGGFSFAASPGPGTW